MKTQNLSLLLTATVILGLFIAFAGSASAQSPATVNATIEGTVGITLATADGDSHCNLTDATESLKPGDTGATDGDPDDVSDDYITIENSGTLNVDMTAYSDVNFFKGGSLAAESNQNVKAVDVEGTSMKTNSVESYTALGVAVENKIGICEGLKWSDVTDSMNIHIQLVVPNDASTTLYSNTITVLVAEDTGDGNQA